MKSAIVDHDAGTLRVSGTVRFADLDRVLKPYNLFIPAGQCPSVAVNGFTLGGGFGFYSRAHGLAVDQLKRTDVVLASGHKVTADPSRHSDLFWACRGGGGGNFGINTSMTFSLFPVGKVSVCTCVWSSKLEDVLNEFQQLFKHVPDTFSLIVRITPATRSGPMTVTALGHYFGPSRELRDILSPVLSVVPSLTSAVLGSRLLEGQGISGRHEWSATLLRREVRVRGRTDVQCGGRHPPRSDEALAGRRLDRGAS